MTNSIETVDSGLRTHDQSKDANMALESAIEDDTLDFPPDEDICDMVKDVNLLKPLPTVTERYFTTYYRINFPKKGDDICIRIHSNRLCMISLAPSHAIFQGDRKIAKIDFQITEKLNRADNAVSGKAKHGAQPLHETSKICTITCSDDKSWVIRCGMNGKLTEANTDLLENPELLRLPPHKGGYLAIVLPKLCRTAIPEKLMETLLTQEAYDAAIRDRMNVKIDNSENTTGGAFKRSCENDTTNGKEKILKIEESEAT